MKVFRIKLGLILYFLFYSYIGSAPCGEIFVDFKEKTDIAGDARNYFGVYNYVGDRIGTETPVFVLSSSTHRSLIHNFDGFGYRGSVSLINLSMIKHKYFVSCVVVNCIQIITSILGIY